MTPEGSYKNIILFGPPGVGKGAQAQILSHSHHLPHFSTGEVIRDEITRQTALGLQVKEAVNSGHLADDELVLGIVMSRIDLKEYSHGFVMDGFPRNVHQAEMLDRLLIARGRKISYALFITAPVETIITRLAGRRICSECGLTYHKEFKRPRIHGVCDVCFGKVVHRQDDTPEASRDRLRTYAEQTLPLEKYYQRTGILIHVNGDQTVEQVAAEIHKAIDER